MKHMEQQTSQTLCSDVSRSLGYQENQVSFFTQDKNCEELKFDTAADN